MGLHKHLIVHPAAHDTTIRLPVLGLRGPIPAGPVDRRPVESNTDRRPRNTNDTSMATARPVSGAENSASSRRGLLSLRIRRPGLSVYHHPSRRAGGIFDSNGMGLILHTFLSLLQSGRLHPDDEEIVLKFALVRHYWPFYIAGTRMDGRTWSWERSTSLV